MLRQVLAVFGVKFDDKEAKKGKSAIDGLRKGLNDFASAISATVLVAGIQSLVSGVEQLRNTITDSARDLGMSRAAIQQWQYAAAKTGVSAGDLNSGFTTLKGTLDTLYRSGQRNHPMLQRLGVAARDSKGRMRDTATVFRETGLQLMKIPQGGRRAQMAIQVFGASGQKLLPLFEKGEKGLDELTQRFRELGGGLNDETLEALDESHGALVDLEVATNALKGKLAAHLSPAIRKATDLFAKASAWLEKNTKGTNILKGAMVSLGIAGAAAGWAMLRPFLPLLITLALVALAIDEAITFMEGGQTVFEDFLKMMGVSPEGIEMLRNDMNDLNEEMKKTPGFGNKVKVFFEEIGDSISKFFTTDIPEAWDMLWKDIVGDQGGEDRRGLFAFISDEWDSLIAHIQKGAENMVDTMINGIIDGIPGLRAAIEAAKAVIDAVAEGGPVKEALAESKLKIATAMRQKQTQFRQTRNQETIARNLVDSKQLQDFAYLKTQYLPATQGVQAGSNINVQNTQQISVTVQATEDAAGDVARGARRGASQGNRELVGSLEAVGG